MNTAESPILTSDRTTPPATVAAQPAGTAPIDFQVAREDHSTTWQAALDADSTVTEGRRPDLFLVDAGQEMPHNCSLARTPDGKHAGWCSCQTFDISGVCPHLCVLRQRSALDKMSLPRRTR